MTERKDFLKEIRRLEQRVEVQAQEILSFEKQLQLVGKETFEMAGAVMEVRQEDVEKLAKYKRQNTVLVNFVETIAESKSKFKKEARKILGF